MGTHESNHLFFIEAHHIEILVDLLWVIKGVPRSSVDLNWLFCKITWNLVVLEEVGTLSLFPPPRHVDSWTTCILDYD
jgi:hypothetical protein